MRKNKAVVMNGSNPDYSQDLLHIREAFAELGLIDSQRLVAVSHLIPGKIGSPQVLSLDLGPPDRQLKQQIRFRLASENTAG